MKTSLVSLLALTALVAAGCAHKPGTPTPETPPTAFGCPVGSKKVDTMEELIAAKVTTAGTVKDIRVTQMKCVMHSDLLRIDATIANGAGSVRRIAYRFEWIDRNGMKVGNDEVWKPVYMYEDSRETVVSSAPSADAVDFRMVLLDQDKERK